MVGRSLRIFFLGKIMLESSKALPAYKIPAEIKKQSWAKKRKKKKGKRGVPEDISEIYKK